MLETIVPYRLALVSTKGGVGKTTLAANLGALLADLGQRTLLVDCDPQPSLSSYYPIRRRAEGGLTRLCRRREIDAGCISETVVDNLDIVVQDDASGQIPEFLRPNPYGWMTLHRALKAIETHDLYDVVIIDSQGAEGIMQDLAIAAADMLISPLPAESLPVREFHRGLTALLAKYGEDPESRLSVLPAKAVINRQTRTRDATDIAQFIREKFNQTRGRLSVATTAIPHSKAYTEAATAQVPAHRYEASRDAGQMPSASRTLHHLVWELLPHLSDRRVPGSDA